MSYKLEYPYTEQERLDFIVLHNHQQGLRIETVDNIVEEERTREITEEREVLDEEGNVIGTETFVVDTEVYYEAVNYPTHYALEANEIMEGGVPIINPNYEAEQEQKERERIAMLSLTRGDVFRGLLLARGVTRLMLRGMIEANEQLTEVQKEMALIDFDEALNFYRGNALIDTVGLALGIEPAQLDCFFETNDYTCLLPVEEPKEEIIEEPVVDNSEEPVEENPVIAEAEGDEV